MAALRRYLQSAVEHDLDRKMVFVGGPRQDTQGRALELRYYRDVEGREVDFVMTDRGEAIGFVECKWSDADVSPSLRYLSQRFPSVPAWQVSATGKKNFETVDGIRVAPAAALLSQLV